MFEYEITHKYLEISHLTVDNKFSFSSTDNYLEGLTVEKINANSYDVLFLMVCY